MLGFSLSLRPRFSRAGRIQGIRSRHHTSLAFGQGYEGGTGIKGTLPQEPRLCPGTWRLGRFSTWVLPSSLRVSRKSPPGADNFMSSAIVPQPGLCLCLSDYPLVHLPSSNCFPLLGPGVVRWWLVILAPICPCPTPTPGEKYPESAATEGRLLSQSHEMQLGVQGRTPVLESEDLESWHQWAVDPERTTWPLWAPVYLAKMGIIDQPHGTSGQLKREST